MNEPTIVLVIAADLSGVLITLKDRDEHKQN